MTMDQTPAPASVGDAAWVERVFGNPAPAAPAPAAAPASVAPQPAAAAPQPAAEETFEQRWERAYGPKKDEAPADIAAEAAKPAALPDFLDQAHPDAKAATPIVQELGLGREQTAKLHALHEQMVSAATERQAATWASEAARLPQNDIADAQTAMRQFATPELKAILNKTGLGNHPALIKAFAAALRSNPFRR